ncbi:MAG: diguanylate cyclase domain-containing protein [Cyanophyceae cyanobacterium]
MPTLEVKASPTHHILLIARRNLRQVIFLKESVYSIGRHHRNSIILPFEQVAHHHATIVRISDERTDQYSYYLFDGNLQGEKSQSGIYVNQKKCSVCELKHGDNIEFAASVKAHYYVFSDSELLSSLALLEKEPAHPPSATNAVARPPTNTGFASKDELNQEELVKLASIAELSPIPIVEIDWEGTLTYLNSAAKAKFPDLKQKHLEHPILRGLLFRSNPLLNALLSYQSQPRDLIVREVRVGPEIFEQYIHYLTERKLIRSYLFDLTVRRRTRMMGKTEERYRAVVKQTREGILLVDAATKKILDANQAYCQLLGYQSKEILKLTLYDIVPVEREILDLKFQQIIDQQQDMAEETQHRSKDGTLIDIEVSVSLIKHEPMQMFCLVVRGITERKQLEQKLQYQAFHDSLTGLPNRFLFREQLSKAIANARRYQHSLGVMFLDLDHFKEINDTMGHAMGDQLLRGFAERLASCLRSSDLLTRWGGDEFLVLVTQLREEQEAATIAGRILNTLKHPFQLEEQQLTIKSSIGIALFPQDGEEVEVLIERADEALYLSKEQGRNNYSFYTPVKAVER